MYKYNIFFRFLSLLVLFGLPLSANISGTVFRDLAVNGTTLNSYGLRESNELGVAGITVTAYPDNITTTTMSDGSWSLATVGDARVEFSNIPSYLKESPSGQNRNSSVRFALDGTVVDFALHNPTDYFKLNPNVAMTLQVAGRDSNYASIFEAPSTVVGTTRTTNGSVSMDGSGNPSTIVSTHDVVINSSTNVRMERAKANSTGAVWGLAWGKSEKKLYTSAVLRRYIGLKNANAGAVYVTDENNLTTLLTTIPNMGYTINDATRDLNPSNWQDRDIIPLIGRAGLGGLEIGTDERNLYTINLNTKELVSIDLSNPTLLTNELIPNPYTSGCADSDVRPWALKIKDNDIYVGSVCESDSRLGSRIQKYDGTNFTLIATTNTLQYPKNSSTTPTNHWGGYGFRLAWVGDARYGEALLADIEFDNNNDLILGYIDRASFLGRSPSSGDIRRMCYDPANAVEGSYVDESTINNPTTCGSHLTMYSLTNTDRQYEEYYSGDYRANAFTSHPENTIGGLAMRAGSNAVHVVAYDSINLYDAGFSVLDNLTGFKLASQTITKGVNPEKSVYQGKAGGMGDIEILSDPAPLEVGDRVWEDSNRNGIQDIRENGISGVNVELHCGGIAVSTATTDNLGNYIFSNDPDKTTTSSHKYGIPELLAGSSGCLIRVSDISGRAKQTVLGSKSLTAVNIGEGINSQLNDSDGVVNGDHAEVAILSTDIPILGANNHSFDFGFKPPIIVTPKVGIGSLIWEDLNRDGLQDDNEIGIADVNVTLLERNGTVVSGVLMQTTNINGMYYFSGLDEGTYSILVSPPTGRGYVPCQQQTEDNNSNIEDDSNIAYVNDNNYTSGQFTLQIDTEMTESNGKTGTDSADDGDDDNGDMSVDFCFYRPASLGNYVWKDLNQNGLQDAREQGVADVNVTLLKDCTTIVKSLKTDRVGNYLFNDLEAGDYCVKFSDLPIGYIPTRKDIGGDDSRDSDVSTTVAYQTNSTRLSSGEHDLTWDMGIFQPRYTLGDKVWIDSNKDGIQDRNELGVRDITVNLYNSQDCRGLVLASQQTDNSGLYNFTNLLAGDYCIAFSNILTNYSISTANQGGDNSKDSDANVNGKIENIRLRGNDSTQDMGIYPPDPRYSLGDKVWIDSNKDGLQDKNEVGMKDIKVRLYNSEDCSGAILATQLTDNGGKFLFQNLLEGDYCIEFSEFSTDYFISSILENNESTNSDANSEGQITNIRLDKNDMDKDMGIYRQLNLERIKAKDKRVVSNSTEAITTISIFSNDENSDDKTIFFIDTVEGEIFYNSEVAVGGTSSNMVTTFVVKGEGTWEIENNEVVTFTAEDGFNGIPTPIYYVIKGANGGQSNVAKIQITTPCNCTPYVEKNISTLNLSSMLFIVFSVSILGLLFSRREF